MATRTKGFVTMTRILLIVAAVAVLLGLAAPVALAAEPNQSSRSFVLSVDRDVDVPAGDHVDTLVVVRGRRHRRRLGGQHRGRRRDGDPHRGDRRLASS